LKVASLKKNWGVIGQWPSPSPCGIHIDSPLSYHLLVFTNTGPLTLHHSCTSLKHLWRLEVSFHSKIYGGDISTLRFDAWYLSTPNT
jgi:hypothetical protein